MTHEEVKQEALIPIAVDQQPLLDIPPDQPELLGEISALSARNKAKTQQPDNEISPNCDQCLRLVNSSHELIYECPSCKVKVCRLCKTRVTQFHDDLFNVFGCPSVVCQDMRRFGKIVWIFFYIAFIPLLSIRYSSIVIASALESLFFVRLEKPDSEPDVMDTIAKFGFFLLGAAFWPPVYGVVVAGSLLYRLLYAYPLMVVSLCKFRAS